MGKFREAAHAAYRAVEEQECHLPCRVAANNLLYEFLLEARQIQLASGSLYDGGQSQNHLAAHMKRAAESLKDWPFRVHDAASAQKVKGCGPALAKIIVADLFADYPPEALSAEELEEQAAQQAALKAQKPEAQKRKAHTAAAVPPGEAVGGSDDEGELAVGGGGRKRSKAAGAKQPKAYIPRIGTANYAFLITLLEVQRGPSRKEFITKNELMELAEASGLADKPIFGDGNPARGQVDARQYYNGWNCFNGQLVNKHNLACAFSNPKKVNLTPRGLALAERLYRDAVARGKMNPIPGIPTEGPLLFQVQDAHPAAPDGAAAAVAAPRQHAPRPSAAAEVAAPSCQQQQQRRRQQQPVAAQRHAQDQAEAGRPVARPATNAAAAAALAGAGPSGTQLASNAGYYAGAQRGRGMQTGASAIAAALAAAGMPAAGPSWAMQGEAYDAAAPFLPQHPHQAAVGAVGVSGSAGTSTQGRSRDDMQGGGQTSGSMSGAGEIISLLDDDDDPPPLAARLARSIPETAGVLGAGGAPTTAARSKGQQGGAAAVAWAADGLLDWLVGAGGAGDADEPAEDDVAVMVEMGFSDKKARKALRRASNVSDALDVIGNLSSDSDSDYDSDSGGGAHVFHDARGEMEDEEQPRAASPPPLGPNPAIFCNRPVPAAAAAAQDRQHHAQQQVQVQPRQAVPSHPVGNIRQGSQQGLGGWSGSQPAGEPGMRKQAAANGRGPVGTAAAAAVTAMGMPRPAAAVPAVVPARGPAGSIRQRCEELRLPPITPGRCFRDEYQVVFLVDGREQYSRCNAAGHSTKLEDHMDRMRRGGISVERRQLKIGDAAWVARSRVDPSREYLLDFIVERKSVDDLVSSIKSNGRYERQKFWLRRCGLWNVYYLLEGEPDMLGIQEQKMIKTAVATIEVSDRFRVLRTKGIQDTFKQYQALTRAIESLCGPARGSGGGHGSGSSAGSSSGASPLTFAQWDSHMVRVTKESVTLHDAWSLMLSAIPGLGSDAVQAIIKHYPTPLSLYNKYRQVILEAVGQGRNGVAMACGVLQGLKRDGGSRGLGPDKAASVYRCLFANSWNLAAAR